MNKINPVFIMGYPRSGTTLLAASLSRGKGVFATPESQFIRWLSKLNSCDFKKKHEYIGNYICSDFHLSTYEMKLSKSETFALIGIDARSTILNILNSYQRDLKDLFWIEHTPENFEIVDILIDIFPEAKFISIIRDPRAVYASHKKVFWGEKSLSKFCLTWANSFACIQLYKSLYEAQFINVYYEDLLSNFDNEILHIFDFLNLNLILGDVKYQVPSFTKTQHKLVSSKPDLSRISGWESELSGFEIKFIEYKLRPYIKVLDYSFKFEASYSKNPVDKLTYIRSELAAYFLKMIGRVKRILLRKFGVSY